ncbi:ferritin heavy chain-like [Hippopotamus amphibius kiboko]|uniref:ferritin heavy chain-like n=1 Tax=Hippopotamus amphibius kiboko TaxID=575201 RepID=UPI002596F239|nr:ferritin heavy chain-like [Hippopotamus amphibius kiboko]
MRLKWTVFAESHCGFLLQQCLDGTSRSSPSLAGGSEPALATTSQRPPTTKGPRRRSSAVQPPPPFLSHLPGRPRPPCRFQNYHQDSEAAIDHQINLELYASCICLSMSYCFDCDDVVLKNFAKYFLHQSREEREHAKKLMKLQNQQAGRIFLQDIKKTDHDDWENGLNAMECALHLAKNVNQSLLELHKLATDKNDPHLCDFIETHYLSEQVKSIKELGDHVTNLRKMGAPESGMAEYLFDKHTLGNSR